MKAAAHNLNGTRRKSVDVLRASVARHLLQRAIMVRENLRAVGEPYEAITYSDGVIIVSSIDTYRDLLDKVDALLG